MKGGLPELPTKISSSHYQTIGFLTSFSEIMEYYGTINEKCKETNCMYRGACSVYDFLPFCHQVDPLDNQFKNTAFVPKVLIKGVDFKFYQVCTKAKKVSEASSSPNIVFPF